MVAKKMKKFFRKRLKHSLTVFFLGLVIIKSTAGRHEKRRKT